MGQPEIIKGGQHSDARGTLSFVNGFDMTEVKRGYMIEHPDPTVIRAWRGHKIEQRWFQVCKGSFEIRLVMIENWNTPDRGSEQLVFVLKESESSVLHIPKGYASSLQALEPHSKIMVFADYSIEHATNDDHLFPADYFKAKE
jgi:dTDP-4-dehydrorhamnose 3,5-epimerase-like enzyme